MLGLTCMCVCVCVCFVLQISQYTFYVTPEGVPVKFLMAGVQWFTGVSSWKPQHTLQHRPTHTWSVSAHTRSRQQPMRALMRVACFTRGHFDEYYYDFTSFLAHPCTAGLHCACLYGDFFTGGHFDEYYYDFTSFTPGIVWPAQDTAAAAPTGECGVRGASPFEPPCICDTSDVRSRVERLTRSHPIALQAAALTPRVRQLTRKHRHTHTHTYTHTHARTHTHANTLTCTTRMTD